MVGKGRHPKNEINSAFDRLDAAGFEVVEDHKGHRWGWVICRGCGDRFRVNSTPKNPGNEAAHIRQFADKHRHGRRVT
jgi:hypothetical protein